MGNLETPQIFHDLFKQNHTVFFLTLESNTKLLNCHWINLIETTPYNSRLFPSLRHHFFINFGALLKPPGHAFLPRDPLRFGLQPGLPRANSPAMASLTLRAPVAPSWAAPRVAVPQGAPVERACTESFSAGTASSSSSSSRHFVTLGEVKTAGIPNATG